MDEPRSIDLGDTHANRGWRADLAHQKDWLCVRIHPGAETPSPGHGLIERLWNEVERDGDHNVILDMNEVVFFPSSLMGELVRLHKRIATHGGRLRLSSLQPHPAEALHITGLDRVLPTYDSIESAVGQ